jgi:asparagine synthase (glutamine-hydrolysing)
LFRRLYPDIRGLAQTHLPLLASFFRLGEEADAYASHAVRGRNGIRNRRFFSPELAALLRSNPSSGEDGPEVPAAFGSWGPLQRGQYLESTIFLPQYLLSSQGDRMAMANSVEARHPFLDYRVVEFCNRLPASLKLRGLRDKYLLRRLGRRYLPREVWRRPKQPYRAPIHKSFFGASAPDYVLERLSREAIQESGFFNPAAVQQLVRKASSGVQLSEADDMALAGILSTQLVYERFVARFSAERAPVADERRLKFCTLPAATPA